MKNLPAAGLSFATSADLAPQEIANLGGDSTVANFGHYGQYSTEATSLFWARATEGDRLIAAVPVVRLKKRKATDMLRKEMRRWVGPILGPLSRKTTLLVDTAFMAYDARSPFLIAADQDREQVKRALSNFLKSQKKVDTIWISEPPEEAAWAAGEGYHQFHTLPMVHISFEGCATLDDYLATLSRNRRRNFRRERETFAEAGGAIDVYRGKLADNPRLLASIMSLLGSSAANTKFNVPYNDVLTSPQAIAGHWQIVLTARVGEKVVGFMSCQLDGDRLMQCHGGLDYDLSHEVLAYHNLISHAIELAQGMGCKTLTLGPMTNETKKRAGGLFRPIISSLWNRNPVDALFARKLFARNFEVYRGEAA